MLRVAGLDLYYADPAQPLTTARGDNKMIQTTICLSEVYIFIKWDFDSSDRASEQLNEAFIEMRRAWLMLKNVEF